MTSEYPTSYKQAIVGFSRSIALGHHQPIANLLQDPLRLLRLWFMYGNSREIQDEVTRGIAQIRVEVWLEVIPQLIARIDHHSVRVWGFANFTLQN